jgi:hypothetical protein
MVISIYTDVLGAEVTAVIEIAALADAQIDRDRVLTLGDDAGCLFNTEIGRCAVAKDVQVVQLAGQLIRVEIHAGGADGTDDPAPVRVAAVNGTLE